MAVQMAPEQLATRCSQAVRGHEAWTIVDGKNKSTGHEGFQVGRWAR